MEADLTSGMAQSTSDDASKAIGASAGVRGTGAGFGCGLSSPVPPPIGTILAPPTVLAHARAWRLSALATPDCADWSSMAITTRLASSIDTYQCIRVASVPLCRAENRRARISPRLMRLAMVDGGTPRMRASWLALSMYCMPQMVAHDSQGNYCHLTVFARHVINVT